MPYKDKEKLKEYKRNWIKQARLKNPEKFKKQSKESRQRHPDKVRARKRKNYWKHRDTELARSKTWYRKNKDLVIQHYGGNPPKCSCCFTSIREFLTIEHKNGGGTAHRKNIGAGNLPYFLVKNNFPDGYDVLCYNCNCAKAISKICPHKLIQK